MLIIDKFDLYELFGFSIFEYNRVVERHEICKFFGLVVDLFCKNFSFAVARSFSS